MCKNFSTLPGLGAKRIAKQRCLATFRLCLPETQVPYSSLNKTDVDLTRYHLIQTYLTSSVYLTISWLALFLPPKSIAERLAIAMTILLTLTAMFSSERR